MASCDLGRLYYTHKNVSVRPIYARMKLATLFSLHGNTPVWHHDCNEEKSLLSKNINIKIYEGWNFNSGNYLFTTDTK